MFDFNISQVVGLLGLEVKGNIEGRSYNVRCPHCGKFHMNIDNTKNTFNCLKCGIGGGILDLYCRYGLNKECTKDNRGEALKEIENLLCLDDKNTIEYKEYKNDYTTLTDSQLNEVYSAILDIPELKLNSDHIESLKKRGLTESEIEIFGYRTMPEYLYFPKGKDWSFKLWDRSNFEEIYFSIPEFKKISRKHIISGLFIAQHLIKKGLKLDKIPGFFKFGKYWCFRYTPGILIPIRNRYKEIVNFQVRKDFGKLRYITLSSKGFPQGTSSRVRVHFPITNPEINSDTIIRITEGPLKADIALSFTTNLNVVYMAVMGVNSLNELKQIFKDIKPNDIKVVQNFLDMDKLTNINVLKGSKNLEKIILQNGHKYKMGYWDVKSIKTVYYKQCKIIKQLGKKVEPIKNNTPINEFIFRIQKNTYLFNKYGIPFEKEWINDNSKGIDDFLKYINS